MEDVRKAQPDAIAHASAQIISRLEESGDKLTEALKSLCWRHNGILAEVNSCNLTLEALVMNWNSTGYFCRFWLCTNRLIDRNSFLVAGSEADWDRFPRF